MSQQRSALDCIRSSSASTVCALRLALLACIMAPHVAKQPLNTGRWSRNTEICDFQIESRKFESNRKSNPKALNRIFYCQIESLIAVKSRFKSNRDWDLPTTVNHMHWEQLQKKVYAYHQTKKQGYPVLAQNAIIINPSCFLSIITAVYQ